jgi:hypothetical protein
MEIHLHAQEPPGIRQSITLSAPLRIPVQNRCQEEEALRQPQPQTLPGQEGAKAYCH